MNMNHLNIPHTMMTSRCIVRLSATGELVDVASQNGAKAFLEQPTGADGFNFFSADLKTAEAVRKRERKKGKLNNNDRVALRDIYRKVQNVGIYAEPELFREKIPKRELEAWLNHAVEILRQKTNDHKWINTGTLLTHDNLLMCSLHAIFLNHPTAVILIFNEIKLLETISDMNSILEKPPAEEYADNLLGIVQCIFYCCRYVKKWKVEKIFKKLESTGILEHFLRCSAVVTDVSLIFKYLLSCTAYIQKNFKEGTPCGDVVREILEGRDGHSPRCENIPYLESLVQLSTKTMGQDEKEDWSTCVFCHKNCSTDKIMHCAKCLQVAYCSKECQKADWKAHKKVCKPPTSKFRKKNASASEKLVRNFVYNRYVSVMVKMVEESEKAGRPTINEMVVEVDLNPDEYGSIPLLQNTPVFNVVPIAKYMDGTHFGKPGAVFTHTYFEDEKDRKDHEEYFVATLKYLQSNRKPTELLCIVSQDSSLSFPRFARVDEGSQKHVFSQEALEAFRSLMFTGDTSLLWEIFTGESERERMLEQYSIVTSNRFSFLKNTTVV